MEAGLWRSVAAKGKRERDGSGQTGGQEEPEAQAAERAVRKTEGRGELEDGGGETGMTSAEDTSSFTMQEARGVQMCVGPNLKGPLTASDPWEAVSQSRVGTGSCEVQMN